MHQARSEHRRSLTARKQNPVFWLLFLSNTLHRYFNQVDLRSPGLLLACSFACKQIAWLDLRSAECNQSVLHTVITCTTTSDTLARAWRPRARSGEERSLRRTLPAFSLILIYYKNIPRLASGFHVLGSASSLYATQRYPANKGAVSRKERRESFANRFRKCPRQISAGPGWSTPEESRTEFLVLQTEFSFSVRFDQ